LGGTIDLIHPFTLASGVALMGILAITELEMNWDRVEGNWKEFAGKAKQQWGKLTDDDLARINGRRDELEGRLQHQYGYAKDKAKKEVDFWLERY